MDSYYFCSVGMFVEAFFFFFAGLLNGLHDDLKMGCDSSRKQFLKAKSIDNC